MTKNKLENSWVVAGLALVFFIPFLGQTHLFDWDEINFAESAREMLVSGNYLRVQIDFMPFWEKPPLFIWLQALSMEIFGVNEFAARFPNAVVGIITLLTFYFLGKRLISSQFGFLWALAYLGSITPHLYFKSGIIDPWFNYFMFLSVVCLASTSKSSSFWPYFWAGICAGLAVWTKGPVGVGIPTLTLGGLYALNRWKPVISWKNLLIYGCTVGLLTLGWMLAIVLESGWATFMAFLEYLYRLGATSEADHGQPFYYHFVVILIGCFPISILGLKYIWTFDWNKTVRGEQKEEEQNTQFSKIMFALFWVVMIVFSIVKTKIVHYSSMAYFPLSYMAALWLHRWLREEITWPRWMSIVLVFVGGILSLILTLVPLIGMNPALFISYIDDVFVVDSLQAPVVWRGYEWAFGVVYFGLIVLSLTIWKYRKMLAIRVLFFSTAFLMFFYTAVVVPKIEGYTQRTVIDFYESKRGQDVYVWPIGNRSYAQFFYFKKPMGVRPEASNEEWLLNGPVDKPTFLISRIDRAKEYRSNPNLEVIKEENGFVFFRRKPDYSKISKSFF